MSLYMIHLEADLHRLYQWAAQEGLNTADAGYLVHAAMRAALGPAAPQPFALMPTKIRGALSVLGYSPHPREYLLGQLQAVATPLLVNVFPPKEILAKAMPDRWPAGRRMRFSLKACPVRRQSVTRQGERKHIEKDAYLAACDHHPADQAPLERAEVYLAWLEQELFRGEAAQLVNGRLKGFQLVRLVRRSHRPGKARRLPTGGQRPEASFEGSLKILSSSAFTRLLTRGVGRHRAFGYGMLLLRPG